MLNAVDIIDLDGEQLAAAGALPDPYLRTLDAIHLAAALSLGAHLAAIVTYDVRMLQAAQARSIVCVAPA